KELRVLRYEQEADLLLDAFGSIRNQTHLAPRGTWTHSGCYCLPSIILQIEVLSESAWRAAA
ncbi:unnamed protein product, partial [Sphacelaria rigidula]